MKGLKSNTVKPYVHRSHERCKAYRINKDMLYSKKILSGYQLQSKIEQNDELIITAMPFMNELYNFVKGSNFFAILTDKEGCILNMVGDEGILSEAYKLRMTPGAYMDEANMGTNAMGTCLAEGMPLQISGEDHYIDAYHKWTCSGAPIRNHRGEIVGALDLTGYCESVHPHTLGMVVAAAKAIRSMMELNQFHEEKKTRKLAGEITLGHAIYSFDKIIGKNEKFLRIIEYAKKISDSRSTILIMGESGTGKEVFAQAIHNYSIRREEPFIAVNCGAIPINLMESELFGYEEGAFTGARKGGYTGKFEAANGGTIFLDEIGELPPEMQTKLLRVIEEGIINRIGSTKNIPVKVRIIAATNKDLNLEIEKGHFRKDLFYRLNVLPIYLPPLRERKDDVPLLVEYFMNRISKKLHSRKVDIPYDYMEYMINYEWPGNIRELENVVELMLNTESLPARLGKTNLKIEACATREEEPCLKLDFIEREHISRVLKKYDGNITLAAKAMGIGRNTLYRKMEKYEIDCSTEEQCSKMAQHN